MIWSYSLLCILLVESIGNAVSFVSVQRTWIGGRSESASVPRRDFLYQIPFLIASTSGAAYSQPADSVEATDLVADLPMIRLRLPTNGLGRDFVAVPLKIQGQGPFEFMVDTGLTTEFITPHLQQALGIKKGKSSIRGLAAGGDTSESPLVELKGASLCCGGKDGKNEITLPTLHAVITDFPQEHIDPTHDPVEGMLGMEMLSLFDVDFDFSKNRVRFWRPASAAKAALKEGRRLVEIPAAVINETGLIGIRLTAPDKQQQPILAFLDCGSTFSAVNWQAAKLLGLPNKGDPLYEKAPKIYALGIDGRPLQLPTVRQQLSFVGDAVQKDGRLAGFEQPPAEWKPWDEVQLAVGDLPAFSSILGDGTRPYTGPAALIGLDVLSQRPLILETSKDNTRKRRVLVSPR